MTYTIVARDDRSGAIGIGCESHFFAPGASVTWTEPGVGAIATQAFGDPRYGYLGLRQLAGGSAADEVISRLKADDPNPEVRQVVLVGSRGDASAFTGGNCIGFAGSLVEGPVAVAGNMLANAEVIPAMLVGYRSAPAGDGARGLARRLHSAMRAAEEAGGDVRGSQGAVLVVVDGERTDEPWKHRPIDLRVDDAKDPIGELGRLLDLRQAFDPVYATMFAPGLMVGDFQEPTPGDLMRASSALSDAARVIGDNQEANFWHAALLARAGRHREARDLLDAAIAVVPALADLAHRLVAARILSKAQVDALRTPD